MRYFLWILVLGITACTFRPIYSSNEIKSVCVLSIPEKSGHHIYQALQGHFPEKTNCQYTLKITTPQVSFSSNNLSDSDFTTMQLIKAQADYSLMDKNKKVVLKNSVSSSSSSAVTTSPYASVVAEEKTTQNLYTILADQIALHVATYLNGQSQ